MEGLNLRLHDMNSIRAENKEFIRRAEHDKLDDRIRMAEALISDMRARNATNITGITWMLAIAAMIMGTLAFLAAATMEALCRLRQMLMDRLAIFVIYLCLIC